MSAVLTAPLCTVRLKRPHVAQQHFLRSTALRRVVRAGRRSGKTTGLAIFAVEEFLRGARVLYAVPTAEQIQRFWHEVCLFLSEPIAEGLYKKNETWHTIELPGTEQRIRAKTAFNADTLRGDYATRLILDEFSLMNEDAWAIVGAPMMLDRAGSCAIFAYTPPSFRNAGVSKAHDPRHAAKLFKQAQGDLTGRWETFHFTSQDNPYISRQALGEITQDMSSMAYRQEILAEDIEDTPGALWTREVLERQRVTKAPRLKRIAIGLDPGHDAGIVAAGLGEDNMGYVLEDLSISGLPDVWARQSVTGFHKYHANMLVAEKNHGAEMVKTTIHHVDPAVTVMEVWASQGKYARAEPISVLYEQGKVWHVGRFDALEDELCNWLPGGQMPSPNRLDAVVWVLSQLMPAHQHRAGTWGR